MALVREFWMNGDALKLGESLASELSILDQSKLAIAILDLCVEDGQKYSLAIRLLQFVGKRDSCFLRSYASSIFHAIRNRTLALESKRNLSADGAIELSLNYLAENVAKTTYNSISPTIPFDEDSFAWVLKCAKDFVVRVDSTPLKSKIGDLLAENSKLSDT